MNPTRWYTFSVTVNPRAANCWRASGHDNDGIGFMPHAVFNGVPKRIVREGQC